MLRVGSGIPSHVVAVADALSFRKAAERCHVSQPSLSAQLAQLENALGVRLFERDRRRVLLTQAGKEWVDSLRVALRQVATTIRGAYPKS